MDGLMGDWMDGRMEGCYMTMGNHYGVRLLMMLCPAVLFFQFLAGYPVALDGEGGDGEVKKKQRRESSEWHDDSCSSINGGLFRRISSTKRKSFVLVGSRKRISHNDESFLSSSSSVVCRRHHHCHDYNRRSHIVFVVNLIFGTAIAVTKSNTST